MLYEFFCPVHEIWYALLLLLQAALTAVETLVVTASWRINY